MIIKFIRKHITVYICCSIRFWSYNKLQIPLKIIVTLSVTRFIFRKLGDSKRSLGPHRQGDARSYSCYSATCWLGEVWINKIRKLLPCSIVMHSWFNRIFFVNRDGARVVLMTNLNLNKCIIKIVIQIITIYSFPYSILMCFWFLWCGAHAIITKSQSAWITFNAIFK